MLKKYLILGSGGYVKDWYSANGTKYLEDGHTLGAMNNAWKIDPERLRIWYRSEDYFEIPTTVKPSDDVRVKWSEVVEMQTFPFCYTKVGGTGTILANVLCHILNEHFFAKTQCWIALAGCDCVYRGNEKDWFYGKGTPDPMRLGVERLREVMVMIKQLSEKAGCSIVNVGGQEDTNLPFARYAL